MIILRQKTYARELVGRELTKAVNRGKAAWKGYERIGKNPLEYMPYPGYPIPKGRAHMHAPAISAGRRGASPSGPVPLNLGNKYSRA